MSEEKEKKSKNISGKIGLIFFLLFPILKVLSINSKTKKVIKFAKMQSDVFMKKMLRRNIIIAIFAMSPLFLLSGYSIYKYDNIVSKKIVSKFISYEKSKSSIKVTDIEIVSRTLFSKTATRF